MSASNATLLPIQGLRFLVSIWVVAYHLIFPSDANKDSSWRERTFWGVMSAAHPGAIHFFFVLTGFALAYNPTNVVTWENLGEFYKRRVMRLFPLYYVSIGLIALCQVIGCDPAYPHGHIPPLYDLIRILSLTQSWFPRSSFTGAWYNGIAYANTITFFLYLVYPLISWILSYLYDKHGKKFIYVSLSGSVAYIFLCNALAIAEIGTFTDHFPPYHIGELVLGIVVAWLARDQEAPVNSTPFVLCSAILVVTFPQSLFLSGHTPVSAGFQAILHACCSAITLFVLTCSSDSIFDVVRSFLSNRLIVCCGTSSYAIYILQRPVACLLRCFFGADFMAGTTLVISVVACGILIESVPYLKTLLGKNKSASVLKVFHSHQV